MTISDFQRLLDVYPLLPPALNQAMSQRANELSDDEREFVVSILMDGLRIHGTLLAEGVNELETILRKAKADERKAAEAADASSRTPHDVF